MNFEELFRYEDYLKDFVKVRKPATVGIFKRESDGFFEQGVSYTIVKHSAGKVEIVNAYGDIEERPANDFELNDEVSYEMTYNIDKVSSMMDCVKYAKLYARWKEDDEEEAPDEDYALKA